MKLQQGIALMHQQKKIGKVIKVLVNDISKKSSNMLSGRSCAEAPEIDGDILILKGNKQDIGKWIDVKINKAYPYQLKGEKIEK